MGLRLYYTSRSLLRVLFRLTGGLEVRGVERVPMTGPLVVASNHASYLDPMLLGAALPRPLAFLARKTLFDNLFFGWFIRSHFAFPLDREGDIREALRSFSEQLAAGRAVVMFPEGTRTSTGKLADITGDKATVSFLYFGAGDKVGEGDDLIEMVTDKATFNVPCPKSGVVRSMLVAENDEVKVGGPICLLDV